MNEWRNWSGSVVAHPAAIVRPRDEAELGEIVRSAAQVRVTGAGHSFMPLCATTGTLVSLDDMVGELVVAPDRQTVDAPAGWSLKRLTQALWAQGLSLPNQGDVNPQTLGGALANPPDCAVLVFEGDSPKVAEDFAKADPYVLNGVIKSWRVREWTTVVGDHASVRVDLDSL